MRNLLPFRSALLFALLASVAVAKEDEPNERSIFLSDHPGQEAPNVYVVGGIVTVLIFEQPCEPEPTRMLGWEGRFKPVACVGNWVLLAPLRDVRSEDRFMLTVTLADGTEIPLTVTAREQETVDGRWGDQQVNVFRDREAPKAVLAALHHSLRREQQLKEKVERYENQDSVNHALAGLLAKGASKQTPFREQYKALFKTDSGVELLVKVYASKNRDKAAVVFKVTNNNPTEPWSLMEARMITDDGRENRPFALRATREYWGPGGDTGQIAVVLDASAFNVKKGPDRLVLELFRRGDGLRQAWVFLDYRLLRE
jgi:uncharacterized protein (TIGR02268 family)